MARKAGVAEAREIAQEIGVGAGIGAQMTPEERKDARVVATDGEQPDCGAAMER